MGILSAKGLQKYYGNRKILENINLELAPGEVVGLLGPNGAGKTTCFYIIAGLIKADQGEVYIGNYNVTELAMYQRSRLGLGYLPQESSIFRGLTVEENIRAVLEITEKSESERKFKLKSILDEFKLKHLASVLATSLSGGERRRLEIARALAANPSFILLDEPFAGVDPVAVGDLRNLIFMLKKAGIGVLITDHNVRETLDIVDRAYIVYDGVILKHGQANEIIEDETVRKVYLGENFVM
ncbi:LPS export ABC transporter ATP-binding protein [Rickettsiales endosymbiont of Stachyamoeba lipophora]|uniref:LPS export ABC transporter ATP-binding protein n=1 Tax=Rickettsiales endosymbiont of Stachyamoeba lipophora TaxID=2486578 RepID=UPI001F49A6EF